jgi:glycosyltransferase involved in cell wall biosynthesis
MIDEALENQCFETTKSSSVVAILMCTYNGERFLASQLDSFESQSHQNWILVVSDDGSTDATLNILRQYQAKWDPGKLMIRFGPKKGFSKNFLSLISDVKIKADFFAFSDQDDVWLPEKLTRALSFIGPISPEVPAVYGARTKLISEDGLPIGLSPLFPLKPSFENALVQSIAGGNTMVINSAAKQAVCIDPKYQIVSHDWWIYMVVTGVGGIFIYDSKPTINYRQHQANLIGGKKGLLKKYKRLNSLLAGNLRSWIESRSHALNSISHRLTPENKKIFVQFSEYRKASFFTRAWGIKKLGIRRQNFVENFIFFLAVLVNKV